ncbi:MAG: EamA family transporter [Hyphomicrobiales bacterium]|nr:EamA family transporter [Hyphomicrobiales bacterium]
MSCEQDRARDHHKRPSSLPNQAPLGTPGAQPWNRTLPEDVQTPLAVQRKAWTILLLTAIFWGGNVVASRLAVGEVSPMAMVAIRWGIVSVAMLAFCWRDCLRQWPVLRANWLRLSLMGFFGFTLYQLLYFGAAHATSGVHLAILQGVAPAFIFAGAWIFYGTPIGFMRGVGLALTMLAVAVVATHGEPQHLIGMDLNIGDVAMLVASLAYAAYTVALRKRPAVSALVFFTALSVVAALTSLPLVIGEMILGQTQWPTPKGWLAMSYIIVFPSLLAQIFFIRGVAMIGPGRASLFYNLVPVLGAIMAVTLLGEPFAPYQAAGLALALGGVLIAEVFGGRKF